ncbi:MAG TPA: M56 family metallopeptidase [Xanthobacteraceae bacterium]
MILALVGESALRLLALGAVVWLALKLLRVRNPHVEMTAWTVVLLASLAMPALMRSVTLPIPAGPSPVQWAQLIPASAGLPFEAVASGPAMPSPREAASFPAPPAAPQPSAGDRRPATALAAVDWRTAATTIYLAVAATLLLRLVLGLALTWRLARRAPRLPASRSGGADLRVSAAISVPVTFGSTILLPPEYVYWSGAKRRAVLAHEGAHVAHRHCYLLLLAVINRAMFWFSPFAWWQLGRLADLAETISDEAAIEALADRTSYADILLEVASEGRHAPAGLAMARPRTVRRRVERILSAPAAPAGLDWRKRSLIVIALLPLIAVCAAGMVRAVATAEPSPAALAAGTSALSPDGASSQKTVPERERAQTAAVRFEDYVGYYQLNQWRVFTVSRSDDQLFAQLTGQRKLPLQPASDGEFVYGSSAVRIAFVADAQGRPNTLVLQRDGRKWLSARVDEAKARSVEGIFAWQIASAPDRFRDQLPASGSREAVLRSIAELQAGTPDYARMSPPLAEAIVRHLPPLHSMLTALGSVESIFFRGVGPGGYDIYGAKFANGFAEFRLLIASDGTIEDVVFRPDGDDTPGGVADCADEGSLRSLPDTAPIRLLLFNDSGADIHLLSVDYAGHRTRHDTIGNERSGSVLTNIAHPWIVTDPAGRCLEIVWPGQRTRFLAVQSVPAGDQPDGLVAPRRTPTAGSEEALRRYIGSLERGQPDYDQLTPEVAGETRRHLLLNQAILARLGPLRAMSFRAVSPLGSDVYMARFANGTAEWRIGLVKDGRIGRIALGPQY